MGYIFLLISLFAGTAKGFCGKKTSGYVSGFKDAMLANTVRMVICIIIGALFVVLGGETAKLRPNCQTILISALSGVATSVFVVCWLVSVKKGAYMMLDVFLMLGVLVPIILSRIFFAEEIGLNSKIGLGILLAAVIIMCSYNNSIKEKMTASSFVILVLCGLAGGVTDFSQKLFVKSVQGGSVSVFNFYTYVFSALTLVLFFVILSIRDKNTSSGNGFAAIKPIFGYISLMSLFLFINSFFKTKAAVYLDSAQLYPMNQGMALVLSSLMSAVCFKEKLTAKCIIGLVVSFIGLIVINVL